MNCISISTEVMAPVLSPAQEKAASGLVEAMNTCRVLILKSDAGMGRTTVLKTVNDKVGGTFVAVTEFLRLLTERTPIAIEETFLELIEGAMRRNDVVIADDLHLIMKIADGCNYPRERLLEAVLTSLLDDAAVRGKTLVFGVDEEVGPTPVHRRAYTCKIDEFTADDYEPICDYWFDGRAYPLDYAKIHRFAPQLTGHQLKNACLWFKRHVEQEGHGDTEVFTEHLSSQNIQSNVEIAEVQPVNWKDLKGVDDVIEALEAKIALPFENDALAAQLQLKPKRGVLLAGPPGTGKTTIGRALAHRLKGKFFLIDGTVIAGSDNFYRTVRSVFRSAKENAPSVVFIDDADLIFEGDPDRGFYRYLLTMLDGLESASAERVCVMMTAMDVNSLPAAIIRSGRFELWLETRLPDMEARAAILQERLGKLPPPIGSTRVAELAAASRGLTGADLKAVVEDGKLLYAHDLLKRVTPRPVEEYFLQAIQTVRQNRRSYKRKKPAVLMETFRLGFDTDSP